MLTTDRIAGGALALLALFVLRESWRLPFGTWRTPGPAYMPALLALGLLVLGVVIAVAGRRAPRIAAVGWSEAPQALVILAVCAFAGLALERLGYRLTMAVALGLLLKSVERKGIMAAAVFALGLAWGSFYLFNTLLRVPLPRGPFGI